MALTDTEAEILDMLADVWNKFGELGDKHPSEDADVAYHVHALQRIIGARPTFRSMMQNANIIRAFDPTMAEAERNARPKPGAS